MNAATLQKKVDAALRRVNGMNRAVYLRTQINVIGDALIGRMTYATSLSLLDPQPVYRQLGKRDLVYLNNLGHQITADDYKFTFSPLSMTLAQLQDPTVHFLLRDTTFGTGGFNGAADELLRIIYVDSESYQGETAVITAIARSVFNDV